MLIFEVCFVLYFLKLSAGKGFQTVPVQHCNFFSIILNISYHHAFDKLPAGIWCRS